MGFIIYKNTMTLKNHLKKQLKALEIMVSKIDDKNTNRLLNDCIKTIKNKKQIIVSALGKNVPIAEKFIGTLNSVGIDGHFVHTNSAIHGDLGIINDGDLVILLSKSGNTEETLKLAKILNNLKTKNWLLTCNNKSYCAKIIKNNLIFKLYHEGDPWNLIPNNSTILFLFFLQGLAMGIIEKLRIGIEVFKRNHPGGDIGKKLEKINVNTK